MKEEAEMYLEHVYKTTKDSNTKYKSFIQASGRKDTFSNWRLFRLTGGIIKRNALKH